MVKCIEIVAEIALVSLHFMKFLTPYFYSIYWKARTYLCATRAKTLYIREKDGKFAYIIGDILLVRQIHLHEERVDVGTALRDRLSADFL